MRVKKTLSIDEKLIEMVVEYLKVSMTHNSISSVVNTALKDYLENEYSKIDH